MKKEMICIACPVGCRLTVEGDSPENLVITGNSCPKGIEYGKEEFLSPKRVVTATLKTKGSSRLRVPVKTDKPLLKKYIPSLLDRAYTVEIKLPVRIGDVIIENYENTGVNLVLTKKKTEMD